MNPARLSTAGLVAVLLTTLLPGISPQARLLAWHLVLAVLLAVVAWLGPSRLGPRRPAAGPALALGLFGAWALVSAGFSPYGYGAFLGLLEIAAFLAVAWLASRSGPLTAAALAGPLLVAAVLETTWAAGQRLGALSIRPGGTLENPNHLAGWLVAVAALNSALLPGTRSRHLRRVLAAGCLVALGGVLLTGSRGALLGLAVAGAWLLRGAWQRARPATRLGFVALLVLLAALVGFRQWQRQGERDPFRYQRTRIWRASIQAVVESPWTGTGPLQFRVAAENLNFPDGDGPLRYDRGFFRTHSDLLRVPCELGWPAALLLLAAAFATVRAWRRGVLAVNGSPEARGAAAALLAIAAQATVENLSEEPAVYLLAAALLGALLSRPASAAGAGQRRPAVRFGIGAAVLWLVLVGDVGPYLAWKRAAALPLSRLTPEQQRSLDSALALNPIHPDLWLRRARHLAGPGSERDPNAYAGAREAAERAVRLQPADARYRAGLAQIEARAARGLFVDVGSRERAEQRFVEAEERSRHNPFFPLERAKFLLATGDPAGARRAAERALAIEPNAVEPRLVLADALLAAGNPAAPRRAERLLAEARALSKRFNSFRAESAYAEGMLRLDVEALARLERDIEERRR